MEVRTDLPDDSLRAFLRAIHADPDSDTPRLVFADWLEDQGDARGEMIRRACAYAVADETERLRLLESLAPWAVRGERLREWVGPLDAGYIDILGVPVRGLLEILLADTAIGARAEMYPGLFAAADQGWVGRVVFAGSPGDLLHSSEDVRRLVASAPRLKISDAHWDLTDDYFRPVAAFPNLREVDVADSSFTDAALVYLEEVPGLEQLSLEGAFSRGAVDRLRSKLPGCVMQLGEWSVDPKAGRTRRCT